MDNKIDFVVLWVDGKDPKWVKEKLKYLPDNDESPENEIARFRDWENMKYWFRAVEKFAPWVNKIHFVTWGHVPSFLDVNNPKINIVKHDTIIEKKYLPTFNSCAIEVNINKIPGLQEKFVYFNDDTFLLRKVRKEDFFVNGLPCIEGLEEAISPIGDSSAFTHSLINNIDIINRNFNKHEQHRKYFNKFFNIKYGIQNIRNISLLIWKRYTGFKNSHLPTPFLKSTWDEVWEKEKKVLDETTSHKLRSYYDVNQYLFRQWQTASGQFHPQLAQGKGFEISDENIDKIQGTIEKQKYKMICLNDGNNISDFDELKSKIIRSFDKVLPEKSAYEK